MKFKFCPLKITKNVNRQVKIPRQEIKMFFLDFVKICPIKTKIVPSNKTPNKIIEK